MGQKVNPISCRLQKTNRHFDSCWYDDYNYTHLLLIDYKIRNYLKTVLHQINYPEGRILNIGVAKKNIINLFYYNPLNIRRKNNLFFQLQNLKENNNNNNKKSWKKKNLKDIHSYFSFPEQQYWKNNTFTLSQQHIGKSIEKDKYSFFNDKTQTPDIPLTKGVQVYTKSQEKPLVTDSVKRRSLSYRKASIKNENIYFSLSNPKKNLYIFNNNRDFAGYPKSGTNTLLYLNNIFGIGKESTMKNINTRFLQFVVDNQLLYNKDQSSTFWMIKERFFIRLLLAQFYCNILQNKENYHIESYTTLCRFKVFFQTENVKDNTLLNKYRNFKDLHNIHIDDKNIYKNSEKDAQYIFKRYSTKTYINDVPSLDNKNNFLHSLSTFDTLSPTPKVDKCIGVGVKGVYSSNLVYKPHLEYTLSKQYSSFYSINLFRTLIEKQSAIFIVQEIIHYLQRKIPFRRIKTIIYRDIPKYKSIKGIRINCSGRVGGRSKKAQRSKTQSVKIGQTELTVFSSKIDFACKSAYTRFGLIGVKVWVCYR